MKKLISAICFLVTLTLFCACGSDSLSSADSLCADIKQDTSATYGYEPTVSVPPVSYNGFKPAAVNFSFRALNTIYDEKESVFFSPAALFSSLSLLENAAAGSTQAQIKKAVNPDLGLSGLNESSGYFLSRLGAVSTGDNKISLSGSVFFNDGTAVGSELLKKNVNFYNQGLFRLNFAEENTPARVNGFLSEQSLGKCGEYFKKLEKDINLVSTAVMSDVWLTAFKQSGEYLTGTEYLLEGKGCKGFIKDFEHTPARFIALMPDKDIKQFLSSFDSEDFAKTIGSMSVFKTADVRIKPIKAEARTDFSTALKALGVDEIFSNGKFGGISFGKKASVGTVGQYASLSIDKNGADAEQSVKSDNAKAKAETALTFDRPYIYLIIDNESNIPVFMGIENSK